MNKTELISAITEETGIKRSDVEKVFESFTNTVQNALKDDTEVSIVGFGKYFVRKRPQREGKNPKTGAKLTIEAKNVPAFKPGQPFTNKING